MKTRAIAGTAILFAAMIAYVVYADAAAAARVGLMPAPLSIDWHRTACPDTSSRPACAEAIPERQRTAIFIVPGSPREMYRHEMGHAFDHQLLTDQDRRDAAVILREPGRAWRSAPNSPHERAAEAYMTCSFLPGDVSREVTSSSRR